MYPDDIKASLSEFKDLVQKIVDAETNKFSELAKIAGLDPTVDFAGSNLSGTDLRDAGLSGADLSDANLSGANLSGADLSDANLSGANLSGAKLSGAKLSGAKLSFANLSGANLSGAYLSGAYLSGANLNGANLSGANLSGAYLRGAQIDDATKLDDKWRLVWQVVNHGTEGQDLSDALIWGITGDNPAPKRKFLRIFSYNDEDERTDKSTVIVLPAFNAVIPKVEVTNQSTSNTLKQKAIENLSRSFAKTAIKNDIIASSFIASSFKKTLLPKPQISWDEEKINFDEPEKITYILIGLSNSQIDNLSNQRIPDKYFSIDTVPQNNFNSFIIKCGYFDDSNNLCSVKEWHSYPEGDTGDTFDYALFAKFEFGNKKIIVCGGITEQSTNRAAFYVSENWEEIYSKLEDEKGDSLDPDDSFAVVIEVPKDEQSKNFVIKEKCIRRIA